MTWRIEKLLRKKWMTADTVQLLREQNEADLSKRTLNEQAALRRAELVKRTAETTQATALVETLQEDRLMAERRAIKARADAEEELAKEFARAEHASRLDGDDLVSRYDRYLTATHRAGASKMGLESFARMMEDYS